MNANERKWNEVFERAMPGGRRPARTLIALVFSAFAAWPAFAAAAGFWFKATFGEHAWSR
jgi:hypothetical protein